VDKSGFIRAGMKKGALGGVRETYLKINMGLGPGLVKF
jgi:hypothetical protein